MENIFKQISPYWRKILEETISRATNGERNSLECGDFNTSWIFTLQDETSNFLFHDCLWLEDEHEILILTEHFGYFVMNLGELVGSPEQVSRFGKNKLSQYVNQSIYRTFNKEFVRLNFGDLDRN